MAAEGLPKRPRGAPPKELIKLPRRFAAVFAYALLTARLMKSKRQATMLAAVVFAPEGSLREVPHFVRPGRLRNVAGADLSFMANRAFNVVGDTGRRAIKVESEARALRRLLMLIEATPGASVWRDKCAKWISVALSTKSQRDFDFAAFNLIRLGFDRRQIERIGQAFRSL